jgi:CheY-like chemotaxis protein
MQSPPEEEILESAVNMRILVADNNATSRKALCGQISQWKADCDEVADFYAALSKIRESVSAGKPYPICFIDQDLPGLTDNSTDDLMREINRDVQVVLTSTSGIFPDKLRDYGNLMLVRRPLKISWLPELINDSALKHGDSGI